MLLLSANSYAQNLKYVDIDRGVVGNTEIISHFLTNQKLADKIIMPHTMSGVGNVFLDGNQLTLLNNFSVERVEELHPSAWKIRGHVVSNSGDSIVYVVESQDKNIPQEMYERKKKKGENSYSEPVLLQGNRMKLCKNINIINT